jgi:hypothetical protein
MSYKIETVVLLLNNNDEPQLVIKKDYEVSSVLATIQVWEKVSQVVEKIVQEAIDDLRTPVNVE